MVPAWWLPLAVVAGVIVDEVFQLVADQFVPWQRRRPQEIAAFRFSTMESVYDDDSQDKARTDWGIDESAHS